MKKVFAVVAALALSGCDEDGAKLAVEAHGFTNVRLTGFVWYGCGEQDNPLYNTKFEASAINGKHVRGFACGGMLKGWTVRLD